jgi:2-polyprenyl-3-methyl-5-hydroxy-6-metoxy-1,4-benzoquinol methylase
MDAMTSHAVEVARGERFEFGANWTAFLTTVDRRRIAEAERSVRDLLERSTLAGQTFLDIGCGSGLFSLAARRLGATVHSIDFDPRSVTCTATLRDRYSADDSGWTVEEGSVLDRQYLHRLGQFDVVYSWGVLHHTGAMWTALELAADRVAPEGALVVALYNDQGLKSNAWRRVKRLYCSGPIWRAVVSAALLPYFAARAVCASLVMHRNPATYFTQYKASRGMSLYHDWKDWLGGYPFEVAQPGQVLSALRSRGFNLVHLRTVRGLGCNEFVFRRKGSAILQG